MFFSNYSLGFESSIQNCNEFIRFKLVKNERKMTKINGWIFKKNPLASPGLVLTSYTRVMRNPKRTPLNIANFYQSKRSGVLLSKIERGNFEIYWKKNVSCLFTKNVLLIKFFCFWSDFDETWWDCSTHEYYNLTNFRQNRMKNKKVENFVASVQHSRGRSVSIFLVRSLQLSIKFVWNLFWKKFRLSVMHFKITIFT